MTPSCCPRGGTTPMAPIGRTASGDRAWQAVLCCRASSSRLSSRRRHPLPPAAALEFLVQDLPAMRRALNASGAAGALRECVQEAGYVVLVPVGWGHATLNLLPSIGLAREFLVR